MIAKNMNQASSIPFLHRQRTLEMIPERGPQTGSSRRSLQERVPGEGSRRRVLEKVPGERLQKQRCDDDNGEWVMDDW